MKVLGKLLRNEQGMETVEWAILAALIVAGLIGVVAAIGTNVENSFNRLQTATGTT